MRHNVRAFIAAASSNWRLPEPICEFGSYQVEGQADVADLRSLFPGRKYIGCDFRMGPGVDRIEDLSRLTFPDQSLGTILCVDTLEHVFEVRQAVDEMIRVLKPGGVILISTPLDFRIHNYPGDYWRLTPSCLERLLAPLECKIVGSQGLESFPHTVFAAACKGPVTSEFQNGVPNFLACMEECLSTGLKKSRRHRPLWKKCRSWLKEGLFSWLRTKGEIRRLREHSTSRFSVSLSLHSLDSQPAADKATPQAHETAPSTMTGSRLDLS